MIYQVTIETREKVRSGDIAALSHPDLPPGDYKVLAVGEDKRIPQFTLEVMPLAEWRRIHEEGE